jgi:Fe-S cluster biosynthesis and repair protein YggX
MVQCSKLEREAPGLDAPPFEGELGEAIFNNVSLEAWTMWKDDMMIKIINEYRLNLSDAEQYEQLLNQMRAFLNLGESSAEQVLEVGNAERGKGQA